MTFAGCYEFASQTPRSGETEDDILVLAYKLYHQDKKTNLSLSMFGESSRLIRNGAISVRPNFLPRRKLNFHL